MVNRYARKEFRGMRNPTIFRAIILLFPVAAQRVSDRYSREFTSDNFSEVLRPLLGRVRKADLLRPGASHLDIYEILRKRLEVSFTIGSGRIL